MPKPDPRQARRPPGPSPLRPDQVERVAASADQLARAQALDEGRQCGLDGQRLGAYAERAVARSQQRPVVTAELYRPKGDPEVGARFWARTLARGRFWRVSGTLAHGERGLIVIRKLAVEPWPGSRAEPSLSVLRALPIAELRERAATELADRAEFITWAEQAEQTSSTGSRLLSTPSQRRRIHQGGQFAQTQPARPKRGRPRNGPDRAFYNALADTAIRIARDPRRTEPIYQQLARQEHAKPETVRKWIKTARQLGILNPTPNTWTPGPNHNPRPYTTPISPLTSGADSIFGPGA